MFIDTHVHLYDKQFVSDRDKVIRRAIDEGVHAFIVPGIDVATSKEAVKLSEKYDEVYAAVGIHPHESAKLSNGDMETVEELSHHKKVVAIGEIGLDYHYDFSPKEQQQDIFRRQLEIASRRNMPVIIHNRKAVDDTRTILREAVGQYPEWRNFPPTPYSHDTAPKGVLHCFDGTLEDAWDMIKMNFHISFPGILTFKNAREPARIASSLSIEHLMLETDAPYMAPVPHRGKRNEPVYVKLVAEKLAELQGLSLEDIVRSTSYTVFRLFGIGKLEPPKVAYKIRNSLYLNITRRCNADCVFCDRKGEAVVKGHNLRIEKEPTVTEIIASIGNPTDYDEIVFCGYGEPTIRLDAVKEVARWIKDKGGKVRLNTDGHGDVINKRNIVPELVGLVDSVSISLNSIDPEQYGKLMRIDGERFHRAMIEFAREAKIHIPDVTMTIVDLGDVDVEEAKRFVEEEVGVGFKRRQFF
jgi:TatD DNase family protein